MGRLAILALLLCWPSVALAPAHVEPPPAPADVIEMRASWYGDPFHGRTTASGVRFDKHAHTAAHRTLPFGTRLLLRNPLTNKTARVVVNDRGPFSVWRGKRYYRGQRDLDVSERVAKDLGFHRLGLATLEVLALDEGCEVSASGDLTCEPQLETTQTGDSPTVQWPEPRCVR